MSTPYYTDESVTLWHGDALEVLRSLDAGSVDCCVTSPPYYGLRDYGVAGQYGLEGSPAEYVDTMRAVFAEVRRVLAEDGTLWLNIGDSYAAAGGHTDPGKTSALQGRRVQLMQNMPAKGADRPPKNLLGIPWRTAFALQDDGWILRNAIVWHKPNAMPESVTDRLASRYETIFLFSVRRQYAFDLDSIREPYSENKPWGLSSSPKASEAIASLRGHRPDQHQTGLAGERLENPLGRNPGDVWSINTQPFSAAHFAVMPVTLAQRCIAAGCKPDGTVLDPFSGSGTTGLAAARLGRKYVGIDLSAEYLDLSLRTRLQQGALGFGAVS
jgi:DNA modification methylase